MAARVKKGPKAPQLRVYGAAAKVYGAGLVFDIECSLVHVESPQLKKSRKCDQPAETTLALIDTGSSDSILDMSVVEQLNLQPCGEVRVNCIGSIRPHVCTRYLVSLKIDGFGPPLMVPIVGMKLNMEGIGCIMGLDLLRHGDLQLTGGDIMQGTFVRKLFE